MTPRDEMPNEKARSTSCSILSFSPDRANSVDGGEGKMLTQGRTADFRVRRADDVDAGDAVEVVVVRRMFTGVWLKRLPDGEPQGALLGAGIPCVRSAIARCREGRGALHVPPARAV
jgi:hypothetical protein